MKKIIGILFCVVSFGLTQLQAGFIGVFVTYKESGSLVSWAYGKDLKDAVSQFGRGGCNKEEFNNEVFSFVNKYFRSGNAAHDKYDIFIDVSKFKGNQGCWIVKKATTSASNADIMALGAGIDEASAEKEAQAKLFERCKNLRDEMVEVSIENLKSGEFSFSGE